MPYRFHANLFARPEGVTASSAIERDGAIYATLQFGGRPPTFDAFFPVTFEKALDALGQVARIDAEPDGFFVLSGEVDGRRWQLDGHLFDFEDRLHRLELHGDCPAEILDAILRAVGWPESPIAFELLHEGIALDEASFRRWAAC